MLNNSSNFIIINNGLFNKRQTELIVLPPKCGVKYFTFPYTVETIRRYAIEGVSSLEVMFIPPSVTDIQEGAFRSCTQLSYINIPESVKILGASSIDLRYINENVVTPNRTEINEVGIEPDEVVELPESVESVLNVDRSQDTQLQRAIEMLTE